MTDDNVHDLPSALRFLDRHVNLEAAAGRIHGLSLDAMRGLTDVMGRPQLDVRTVHVTGTNGKGSVSAMCRRCWSPPVSEWEAITARMSTRSVNASP